MVEVAVEIVCDMCALKCDYNTSSLNSQSIGVGGGKRQPNPSFAKPPLPVTVANVATVTLKVLARKFPSALELYACAWLS